MPRSIWKGAISFGLVTIPVKLYSATEEKDISFRQVHPEDGGRIKYKRVCEKCGQEIPYAEIAKGYETPDGRLAILEKEDFEALPLATTKAVEVVQFVAEGEVDPTYFAKTYFLQADGPGVKPYVLLRDALLQSEQCAVVKVALRSREAMALIRPKEGVLLMHTMLWPDELRDGAFAAPPAEVTVSDAEVKMAQSFIDALSGEFHPEEFTDSYREALEQVVQSKLSGVEMEAAPEVESEAEVVDLVAALRASVEAAKKRREEAKESKAV
ncbi:Ku protein [Microlunatus panaciterrae]|uniref:Non-homologous end joining protein Ku n=1 Tax=Microlunatus panaciterrae TaxID=400768 RepID=A0ABS2REV0_9ACTN|nr:Ku protein [Microlunatus panaciterrae]MBM7797533.1 DNA end-binding protein Ku [Microlunatus panaciterrae]